MNYMPKVLWDLTLQYVDYTSFSEMIKLRDLDKDTEKLIYDNATPEYIVVKNEDEKYYYENMFKNIYVIVDAEERIEQEIKHVPIEFMDININKGWKRGKRNRISNKSFRKKGRFN